MDVRIRRVCDSDIEDLVQLSLLAWVPVFDSFRNILGPGIYPVLWPDWQASQRAAVEAVCKDREKRTVLVAELDGKAVGFLAYELDAKTKVGEVQLLAVHPDHQNRGIGTELNVAALSEMRERGMKMAQVDTGGEPSHAPARRSYEKAGYTALPLVRYFKDL